MKTDFLTDPSKGSISGMRVPPNKVKKLSILTVPVVSSSPTQPLVEMAAIAESRLPRAKYLQYVSGMPCKVNPNL